ncbi:adenylyl cyclase-associated protein [Cryptococcus neoformans c45]|nr:adenylyl cyclase-associated protein [Cryptococcus neoformans var. grubii c45]
MATSQGIHSISTILKRLEAVTSRLEDIAVTQTSHGSPVKSPAPASDTPTGVAPPAPPPPPAPEAPKAAEMTQPAQSPASKVYQDEIINGALNDFLSKSKEVGGLVAEHSALIGPLCEAQLSFLQFASNHAKPATPNALAPLLEPQGKAIEAIMETKDKLSRSKEGREWGVCFNVLGEGVPAWGWIQVEPTPAPYVGEMKNAAQFWSDRVIKQYKETNASAVAWAKSFIALVAALESYVKQWHTTGVVWNPKGSPAPSSMPKTSASAPSPPPPPPSGSAPAAPTSASGAAALLADLNRGGAVTSGLRKVDSSQMTHKNPSLRSAGTVSDNAKKGPPLKPKPGAKPAKKPAKIELEDGNKWIIENQEDNRSIKIDNTELHHTVHIFGCVNSVVQISGKINAVTMAGCKKTSVVLDSAVSSFSITSSPSFEVQIIGSIPTIQIDTTDSGQVYLSKDCMEVVEIVTSKSSSINISVPTGEDGDFVERPVPEQMKSRIIDGKLVTEIVEHSG